MIEPRFSCLDKFLEWYELNDEEYGDEEVEDENFCLYHLMNGNQALKVQNIDLAIESFQLSINSFPELSEPWYKLGTQYYRKGQKDKGNIAIINSILSNWAIDYPSDNAIRTLKNLKESESISNNPIFKRKDLLSFEFGVKKVNNDYQHLREAIDEFMEIGDIVTALKLEQNYGYMMLAETSSFQERYNFNAENWKNKFEQAVVEKLNRKYLR